MRVHVRLKGWWVVALVCVVPCLSYGNYVYGPDEDDICYALGHDQIVDMRPMSEIVHQDGKHYSASHPVFLITLKSGIKGVYKIQRECEIFAEVAAYRASRMLHFSFVPPTTIRVINGKLGSVQMYVKTNIEVLGSQFEHLLALVPADDLANIKIFLYVFGQHDAVAHNMLMNKEQDKVTLFAIDNGCIAIKKFWQYGKNPFIHVSTVYLFPKVGEEKNFPYSHFKTMPNYHPDELKKVFGSIFSLAYYKNKLSKYKPFRYIIFNHQLWVQKKVDEPVFCFITYCPADTLERLKALTKLDLVQIFSSFRKVIADEFVDDDFLNAILDRRDQVVAYFDHVKRDLVREEMRCG